MKLVILTVIVVLLAVLVIRRDAVVWSSEPYCDTDWLGPVDGLRREGRL